MDAIDRDLLRVHGEDQRGRAAAQLELLFRNEPFGLEIVRPSPILQAHVTDPGDRNVLRLGRRTMRGDCQRHPDYVKPYCELHARRNLPCYHSLFKGNPDLDSSPSPLLALRERLET